MKDCKINLTFRTVNEDVICSKLTGVIINMGEHELITVLFNPPRFIYLLSDLINVTFHSY